MDRPEVYIVTHHPYGRSGEPHSYMAYPVPRESTEVAKYVCQHVLDQHCGVGIKASIWEHGQVKAATDAFIAKELAKLGWPGSFVVAARSTADDLKKLAECDRCGSYGFWNGRLHTEVKHLVCHH